VTPPRAPERSSDRVYLQLVVLGALFFAAAVTIGVASGHWPLSLVVLPFAGRWLYGRRRQWLRRRARRAADEAERVSWRSLAYGPCSVVVDGFGGRDAEARSAALVSLLPGFADDWTAVEELVDRIRHVGAQPVAEGISHADADRLRAALEARGAHVRVLEAQAAR
jgi:hypothetical protein